MATVQFTRNDVSGDGTAFLYTWVLGNADDGVPIGLNPKDLQFSDCCFSCEGTIGGATIVFEGTNGSSYATLNNVQGTAITGVAVIPPKQVVEVPLLRRPRTSGGLTTSLTCYALVRRQQPARL